MYYIWSYRNRAWYKSDRQGYTLSKSSAGVYDKSEAASITLSGLPGACVAVDVDLDIEGDADEVEARLEELRRI